MSIRESPLFFTVFDETQSWIQTRDVPVSGQTPLGHRAGQTFKRKFQRTKGLQQEAKKEALTEGTTEDPLHVPSLGKNLVLEFLEGTTHKYCLQTQAGCVRDPSLTLNP